MAGEYIHETEAVIQFAELLLEKGIKTYDALHIACAAEAGCNFFITTDRKLLHLDGEGVKIINPISFIMHEEKAGDDR